MELKLENAFATPMERIPIRPGVQLDDPYRQQKLISKLAAMKQTTKILRSTTNLLVAILLKFHQCPKKLDPIPKKSRSPT